MLGELLVNNIWLAVSVWSALYFSDYCLTIWAARLYKSGACEHLMLEGSLEITPYFQEDVNALRLISLRFLRALAFSVVMVSLAWVIAVRWTSLPQAFSVLMGALIFIEAAVHIRHLRNIAFFRSLKNTPGLRGKIEYPRWLSLRLSSVEILAFSGLFLLAFFISGSWFFVGGVASCLLTGLKHRDWADKARATVEPAAKDSRLAGLGSKKDI